MKKYKVGIVGCGGIGHAHMEGYKKLDNNNYYLDGTPFIK